jgi:ribosomal protein RSM22 (predicted rRNA methylase)
MKRHHKPAGKRNFSNRPHGRDELPQDGPDTVEAISRYPASLEAWWAEQTCRRFRTPDRSTAVKRMVSGAGRLTDLFTLERAEPAGSYFENEELLLAYGVTFFPQSFARTILVLEELAWLKALPSDQEVRLLDLGAGAGAAAMAAARFYARKFPETKVTLELVDRSEAALARARTLHRDLSSLWPGSDLKTTRRNFLQSLPESEDNLYDLILCSFALGEAYAGQDDTRAAEDLRRQMTLLKPGGLLIVLEPALKETSHRIMKIRDEISAGGLRVVAPCPHQFSCPLREEGKYWCHEVRTWQPNPDLQRVNSLLHRRLHELKWSFVVFQKPPEGGDLPEPSSCSRLVAPMSKQKGRFVTRLCSAPGELQEVMIPLVGMDPATRRRIRKIERGDRVTHGPLSSLKTQGSYRLDAGEEFSALWTPERPPNHS